MTGLELRRGLLTFTIPVIMQTSLNQTSDKMEGMQVGADDCDAKPFASRNSSPARLLTCS